MNSPSTRKLDVVSANRDGAHWLDMEFLLRSARQLVAEDDPDGSITDVQIRNFTACDGATVECRLAVLSDVAPDRVWRATFHSAATGAVLAEATFTVRRSGETDAVSAAPDAVREASEPEQNSADPRWRRLFEAACDVIDRKGYGAASMREIAKAAELPIGTMYQQIGAKEDLLFMITKGCMDQLFETFDRDLGGTGPAEADLQGAISAYVDYIGRNRKYINLVYRETRSLSAENRARIFAIERAFAAKWQAILDKGVASGRLRCRDTAFAAHALYFLCTIWALRHWAIDDYGADDVKRELSALVLDGLKAA